MKIFIDYIKFQRQICFKSLVLLFLSKLLIVSHFYPPNFTRTTQILKFSRLFSVRCWSLSRRPSRRSNCWPRRPPWTITASRSWWRTSWTRTRPGWRPGTARSHPASNTRCRSSNKVRRSRTVSSGNPWRRRDSRRPFPFTARRLSSRTTPIR